MMSTSSPWPTTSYGGARQFEPSKKRKERDGFEGPPRRQLVAPKSEPQSDKKPPVQKPKPVDNRLLAGYLAHEFLTCGTLFGKPFQPSGAEKKPESDLAAVYADVARLLKGENGAHIPGIVNPTQLGLWLQKQ